MKHNSASNGHRLTKIEGTIFRNTHKLTYLGLLRIDMVRSSVSPPLGAINSMTGLDRIHGNIHGNWEDLRWELTHLIDYMRSDLWRLRHTYDRSSCRLAVRLSPLRLHLPVGRASSCWTCGEFCTDSAAGWVCGSGSKSK